MKNLKIVDSIIVLGVILALIVGFFTFKHFRQTASNQIEATSKIAFQVFLRGVTVTGRENPIVKGEKTFISIRNVPYTELEVIDVRAESRKTIVPSLKTKDIAVAVNDLGQPYLYDMIVTIVDTAKITKDGAVVGGNKIKIGLPITLEGSRYKFNGTVSDVRLIPDEQHNTVSEEKGHM